MTAFSISRTALLGSTGVLLLAAGGPAAPSYSKVVPAIARLIVQVDCSCKPDLQVEPPACQGPMLTANCFTLSKTPGLPNQPLCSDKLGCSESVACDAAPGTVSVTPRNIAGCCTTLYFYWPLGKQPFGSIAADSPGSFDVTPIGGRVTPCTKDTIINDNTSHFDISCASSRTGTPPVFPPTSSCRIIVKDVCIGCDPSSDGDGTGGGGE